MEGYTLVGSETKQLHAANSLFQNRKSLNELELCLNRHKR